MSHLSLDARALRPARLQAPPSKSDALRLVALASLLKRPAWLEALGPRPWASDIQTLAAALAAITGPQRDERLEIDCGDGAAPLRIVLGLCAITPGRYRIRGTPRLGERGHSALLSALRTTLGSGGLTVREGDPWPIELDATGRTAATSFRVSAAESSQPASALLLAAGALALREGRPWTVEIEGDLVSPGYLELTLRAMQQAGFRVERSGSRVTVVGWDQERSRRPDLPADWSAAGFLLPIAWRTGGTVLGLDPEAAHPDRSILELLRGIGLTIVHSGGQTTVSGQARGGLQASGRETPDLIPALAALACVIPEPSHFTEVERLRHKESDRLAAVEELVQAAGGRTHLEGDTLRVEPSAKVPAQLRFDARDDHRMVMAATTLAILLGRPLTLEGAAGIEKSFPQFFDQLEIAGLDLC